MVGIAHVPESAVRYIQGGHVRLLTGSTGIAACENRGEAIDPQLRILAHVEVLQQRQSSSKSIKAVHRLSGSGRLLLLLLLVRHIVAAVIVAIIYIFQQLRNGQRPCIREDVSQTTSMGTRRRDRRNVPQHGVA